MSRRVPAGISATTASRRKEKRRENLMRPAFLHVQKEVGLFGKEVNPRGREPERRRVAA
ncbi:MULTISPECIES: hypothetical protein [unclassified Serratia (in: enterobacteria)]|uniref:hypothetical protein n=1 Tax=unclassified Serratia (in: enterobacteria) TaxID=2647522 RepID=UPI002ECFE754|nr:hypothetical protein [Serratia sp. C2(2)]MEE4448336.1 hypothetical protein [Serratia sp. C2(1)]